MIRRAWVALLASACGGDDKPPPVGAQVGPALVAALAAADQTRLPWRCVAPDGPQHPELTLTIGDATWKLSGHGMRREGKPRRPTVIGAIADAGGAAPTTLAALGRLKTKLANADLVLALGGMGATQAELEATLGAIAQQAPYPVVALPGDLEPAPALTAAVAALRARGMYVVDGRLLRHIDVPGATIALVPGGGATGRRVAGTEGCAYQARDVTGLFVELTGKDGIRIVASAEAPRVTVGGEASGELALTPNAGQEIDVVLHGPTTESATRARAGARDGGAATVTPGTADATLRLPGPLRPSTAGLMTIAGGAWSWKSIADAH